MSMNHPPVEVDGHDDLADVTPARVADRAPEPGSGLSGTILVVCAGNVARSPIAAALLRARLGTTDVSVRSAGLEAVDGQPVAPEMVRLLPPELAERATARTSRRLDKDMIESADLILTASRRHRAAVASSVPLALKRVFTLGEFAALSTALAMDLDANGTPRPATVAEFVALISTVRGRRPIKDDQFDVPDPMGRRSTEFRRAFALLDVHSAAIAAALAPAPRRRDRRAARSNPAGAVYDHSAGVVPARP
jgi:protein-tyrosine phosphatase